MFRRLLQRIDAATWVVIGLATLSAVIWAVRLEAQFKGRAEAQDLAIAGVRSEQAITNAHVIEELRYIRQRVDELAKGKP